MPQARLTTAQLASVPMPNDVFDLSKLLPEKRYSGTARFVPGFETVAWCALEDSRRADALRALPAAFRPSVFDLQRLTDALYRAARSNTLPRTFASALRVRDQRLRLLGTILEFLSREEAQDLGAPALFTITDPAWRLSVSGDWEWDCFAFRQMKAFRSALTKAGVITAPGFLFAYLQGQFDAKRGDFQLEYRGLCAGTKLDRLHQINTATPRPGLELRIHQEKLDPWHISRIMPNFVPMLPQGEFSTDSVPFLDYPTARVPEPFHSLYVMWLHMRRDVNFFTVSGAHIVKGLFRLAPDMKEVSVQCNEVRRPVF